jgi:hypothetical protein
MGFLMGFKVSKMKIEWELTFKNVDIMGISWLEMR